MAKTFVYFDECGDTKSAPFFLLGLLFVTDRKRCQGQIKKIRDEFHFRNEMKFMKVSGLRTVVYADAVVRKKEDQFLKEVYTLNLEFKHDPIKHVEPIDSKNDDLLQMCDLLLGAVNNELTQNTNPFKKKLRSLVLKRLGKETFTGGIEDEKVTVWRWKPGR